MEKRGLTTEKGKVLRHEKIDAEVEKTQKGGNGTFTILNLGGKG